MSLTNATDDRCRLHHQAVASLVLSYTTTRKPKLPRIWTILALVLYKQVGFDFDEESPDCLSGD